MLQSVRHIFSGTLGEIIGYNGDIKAHLIKLSNGQKQFWRENSFIKEGSIDMTKKILIKLSGKNAKWYSVIERYFDDVKDANDYLMELKRLNDITGFSESGEVATISNGWTICSNYDIREILKSKPPQKELYDDYPFGLRRSLCRVKSSHTPKLPEENLEEPIAKKMTGKIIKLSDLTKDTRKARVILRGLVRQKKIVKPSRWEWQEGSPELELIKSALNK